jgi:uncharacterized membrane protein
MDWEIFIGRFHPLMVHLPIGIFILGYILEVLLQTGFRNLVESRKIVILTYGIGFLAGLVAAITGWLLSHSNAYGIEALNDHKQLGILTLVAMLLVIIYQIKAPNTKGKLKLSGSTIAIVLISLTGHLGGNLTHGPTYLVEYGPDIFMDDSQESNVRLREMNPDSLMIYADIIQPLIQYRCLACHNSEENFGGLILETYSDLFKEAAHEIPVVAGSPDRSEFLKRVSLPLDHEKIMPPEKAGFSYTDVKILRYWIENGADSLASFNSETMNEELIGLIYRDYGLDYSPKPYYEKIKVDSLGAGVLEKLKDSGFRASYLGQNNLLLDIEYKGDSIGEHQIQMLNQVSKQITFLKIADSKLSDDLLEQLDNIEHLCRIDLSNNQLGVRVIDFLIKHPHLESTNLNNTNITKESLQQLLSQPGLKRVYVMNTKVTAEEIEDLRKTHEAIEIISQFQFEKVAEAKSVFAQEAKQ